MSNAAERLFADRHVDPHAVSVPLGFRVEVAALGLNNPSCIEFDQANGIYIAETSSNGTSCETGRIVRLREDGSLDTVADGFTGSITGIAFRAGEFYILEHGECGRVYCLAEDGSRNLLFDNLPGGGDHPTSDIVVSHSERLYFGLGTRTNSGVVGVDNASWVRTHPYLHDIPGEEVTLTGMNFVSPNLFGEGTVWTGAFQPFGVGDYNGETVKGSPLCSGGILRADPDEGKPSLFAWGFRRPMGISVHQDGRIFCTDTGMEDRGSRPISGGRSYLWNIQEGNWYGWPDFEGGLPVTDPRFKPEEGLPPDFVMREHPRMDVRPVISFPQEAGVAKFDFSRSPFFGNGDTAFLALMGKSADSAISREAGYRIVRAHIRTGVYDTFAGNRHPGPASVYRSGGLERPAAVKFDRTGEIMYVLDMGTLTTDRSDAPRTLPNTGVLWRIRPEEVSA